MELQSSGSPVGSGSAGKMPLGPQILHAATAVTMAAKAKKGPRDWVARSRGVGMLDCLFREERQRRVIGNEFFNRCLQYAKKLGV